MSPIILLIVVVVAAVAAGAGYFIGYNNRKKTAEAQIGSAEAEATRLVNEAIKTADQKRKEAVLEAKDEAFRLKAEVDAQKAEADKEIKQRRAEISRQENRIDQKENALDRKTEALEKKEEELKKKHEEADSRLAEVDAIRAKEMERLETLAGLSQEDAREVLLHKVDEELTHEKAVRVAAYETDLKENCDNIARNMIGQAISRCAADHVARGHRVSVVPLPNDEMKGRIIGREGRNIRTLETAHRRGPHHRRHPGGHHRLLLRPSPPGDRPAWPWRSLILDGRIHPARIEEMVEKCRQREVDATIKAEGERAVLETSVHGLHPELVKLHRPHEVPHQLRPERAHPLHRGGPAGRPAGRRDRRERRRWPSGPACCTIWARPSTTRWRAPTSPSVWSWPGSTRRTTPDHPCHRGPPRRCGAQDRRWPVLFRPADAISAARPGARRENVENYVKRLENLEEISSTFEGVEQAFAIQAGREVRIMVKPDVISDDQVILLAREIAKKIEDDPRLSRPDQGQRHPREPRHRVREVRSEPRGARCVRTAGSFFVCEPLGRVVSDLRAATTSSAQTQSLPSGAGRPYPPSKCKAPPLTGVSGRRGRCFL